VNALLKNSPQVIDTYGSDMTRLLILSDVSPLSDRNWSPEDSHVRISNMLSRLAK
jgi:leucyl-tRNA synthetase